MSIHHNIEILKKISKTESDRELMYFASGLWISGNWLMAAKCYYKAAEHGCAFAQRKLAECYEMGIGVEQNDREAIYWYREAAVQGDGVALCNLADYYYMGKGVKRDDALAKALLLLSPDCKRAAWYFYQWYGMEIDKPGIYTSLLQVTRSVIQRFISDF